MDAVCGIKRSIAAALAAAALLSAVGCTVKNDQKEDEEGGTGLTSGETQESEEKEPELFDIADREDLVSICYSTWFNPVINQYGDNPHNVSEVLAGNQEWGNFGEVHYWGKPALGYYKSNNKEVIRTHMTQLAEAGVDFIIIDNTNANLGWKESGYWTQMISIPCRALLDTIVEMRAEGLTTPYVVMWCGGEDWTVVDEIYEKFYTKEKYKECWVYWNGRPFFLTTAKKSGYRSDITWRMMWGLRYNTGPGEWSFLQQRNSVNYSRHGEPEQICVCVASQAGYMSDTATALGREGGRTFWHQWQNAFAARPKVVTITWWNEWIAFRFPGNKFVDNYNEEYSRDIEPMEGGHGDRYYQWMKQYIAAYKAHEECPELHD